jgi:hypothetical protein
MRLGQSREIDFSRGSMALQTYFLPSRRRKMRLWLGRGNEDSGGLLFLRTHCLLPARPKMRLRYGGESDVSRVRWDLRNSFSAIWAAWNEKVRESDVSRAL